MYIHQFATIHFWTKKLKLKIFKKFANSIPFGRKSKKVGAVWRLSATLCDHSVTMHEKERFLIYIHRIFTEELKIRYKELILLSVE